MTRIYATKTSFEAGEKGRELATVGLWVGANLSVSIAVFLDLAGRQNELVLVTLA